MKFDEFNNIEVPEEVDVFIKNENKKVCSSSSDIGVMLWNFG